MPAALARVLELEATSASRSDYAAALRGLAEALRRDPEVRSAMAEWLLEALGLEGGPRSERGEDWWDAAADVVGDAEGLATYLDRVAEASERRSGRLNLQSMLRTRVSWRAKDQQRRRAAWASRRSAESELAGALDEQSRWVARLVLGRLQEQLADDPQRLEVIRRLLQGETVSEAARSTGVSRPTIYRWLTQLRAWLEGT